MSQTKDNRAQAKIAHLDACLKQDVEHQKSAGFERYDFVNEAGSEIAFSQIDLSIDFLGKKLGAPLMIAPMTGGVERGLEFNRLWARVAETYQIAMGVGSQRVGLEQSATQSTYQIRKDAPTALLFGNLGAGQLCRGWGVDEARRAVAMIEADALFIHLNAMQEVCQGGDVNFTGLLSKIEAVCVGLQKEGVPVFAREVGFGFSQSAAKRLLDTGIAGIDCGGAGGTSWTKVESICAKTERERQWGMRFAEWGIPTVDSIQHVRAVSKTIPLIATGGLRSGQDVVKSLLLGADVGAMARPFLLAADAGESVLDAFVADLITEMKMCLFGLGARDVRALKGSIGLVRL